MDSYILTAEYALLGENLEIAKDRAFLISGGRIEKILEKAEIEGYNLPVKDKENTFLMPGLIECHNHLALDARIPDHLEMMELSECEHTLLALNGLKDDLNSGVTTARCLGDRYYLDIKLKKKIESGEVYGPNLLASGIGMKGLHGHGYVGMPHSGAEEFRKRARENIYQGADILKIFVTPGLPAASKEEFIPCFMSYDEIRTVAEEARSMNIKTAAHCIGGKGLEYCVRAGVDVLEHLYSVTEEDIQLLEEEFEGWIDMTSGIVLNPDREAFCSEAAVRKVRGAREYSRSCINRIYKSGKLRYTIGTDAYHGLLYKELVFAKEGGADNITALKAVTSNAALMCGIEKRTGSLKEGLAADIIAVDGNPLEDIEAVSRVELVIKGGKVIINKNRELNA